MTNNTQLPDEVLEAIELKAEHEAALHFNPTYSRDQNTACLICYRNGATEYAIKLHKANYEITQLKQWKIEASELLNPILDYGQSKEAGFPLGESITGVVLERCKQADAARSLLEKLISSHENCFVVDKELFNEIKTFLDGKK